MSLVRTTPRTGPMKRQLITKLHATLEKLVHKETATGTEFWLARDLQEVLGYVRWANFEKVIQKAMVACELRRRTTSTTTSSRSTRSTSSPIQRTTSATTPSPATPAT